jgi:hypothetical protein
MLPDGSLGLDCRHGLHTHTQTTRGMQLDSKSTDLWAIT